MRRDRRRPRDRAKGPPRQDAGGSRLGWLPAITLCAAAGLFLCTVNQSLAHATRGPSMALYWLGLLLIGVPIFYRLTSEAASPAERLALVVLLGVALYGVKIVRDPLIFGYTDEPVHAFNADQIAEHGRLFSFNPLLPVTAYFPGLEGATSALMDLTGLGSFGAGLIVVGFARLLMMLALFALFWHVSGSPRAAGLGAAVYVGSFNFLYFSAQYSYESLALPLFVTVLAALAERGGEAKDRVRSWLVPLTILIAAIVVVHHVTSYLLVLTLGLLALFSWRLRRDAPNPWPFALLAAVITVAWLFVVASTAVGYLQPVLDRAFTQTIDTVKGTQGPRALFGGGGTGASTVPTPILARAVGLAAVVILLVAAYLGLRATWPRVRRQPFLLLFALGAVGFFATLPLRFVPAAWETGNRASGFLFIGLAFIVVCATLHPLLYRLSTQAFRAVITGGLAIILIGGIISGWPWDLHLGLPSKAALGDSDLPSETLGLGQWAGGHLPNSRFAAPAADARLLMAPGGEIAFAGAHPDVQDALKAPRLGSGLLQPIYQRHMRYVVADVRERGDDPLRGYPFSVHPPGGSRDSLRPFSTRTKWEKLRGTTRIYDSGRIVLYDLKGGR